MIELYYKVGRLTWISSQSMRESHILFGYPYLSEHGQITLQIEAGPNKYSQITQEVQRNLIKLKRKEI